MNYEPSDFYIRRNFEVTARGFTCDCIPNPKYSSKQRLLITIAKKTNMSPTIFCLLFNERKETTNGIS